MAARSRAPASSPTVTHTTPPENSVRTRGSCASIRASVVFPNPPAPTRPVVTPTEVASGASTAATSASANSGRATSSPRNGGTDHTGPAAGSRGDAAVPGRSTSACSTAASSSPGVLTDAAVTPLSMRAARNACWRAPYSWSVNSVAGPSASSPIRNTSRGTPAAPAASNSSSV